MERRREVGELEVMQTKGKHLGLTLRSGSYELSQLHTPNGTNNLVQTT